MRTSCPRSSSKSMNIITLPIPFSIIYAIDNRLWLELEGLETDGTLE